MAGTDYADHIRSLTEVAVGILRRNARGTNLILADGTRVGAYETRHNELSLSFHRKIDIDRMATLTVKFAGAKVLVASWTAEGFTRRSYTAGAWGDYLRRCDRMPALAGTRRS